MKTLPDALDQPERSRSSLSTAQVHLLEIVQRIGFGRVENLTVRDGEPVFDPAPRVVREIKIGGESSPRHELGKPDRDFALKGQIVELFDHLKQLENGTVQALEVRHSLPFRLVVELPASARLLRT
jgi:hypothetical protein